MQAKSIIRNALVAENAFQKVERETMPPPTFAEARDLLPKPFWSAHRSAIDCYWHCWQRAIGNLLSPTPESGFVANFIDTAYNGALFLWDSVFILMFGRYGSRAFDFQRTLDNFYARQHEDCYICREIEIGGGEERWSHFDPSNTGPNVFAWGEWEYYLHFGDKERLARVFPVLAAYQQWLRMHRSWQDGTYWGNGMTTLDNQPRVPRDVLPYQPMGVALNHGHMSWIDVSVQQVLACRRLVAMATALGRESDAASFQQEIESLNRVINETMWDEESGFYYDRFRDGRLSNVKTVATFWALLADVVPKERLARFIDHLRDPREFNRAHRVPSISADTAEYDPKGLYWLGSVWPPTNYMILRGLTQLGEDDLAHEIGVNHHESVVKVFENTGSVWENYAPDAIEPGSHSMRDMVGWSGLGPIAVFFEYVLGLRAEVAQNRLIWDVRLLEEHGVEQYPFGKDGTLDLHCGPRSSQKEQPDIQATTNTSLDLEIRWEGESEVRRIG